MPSKKLTKEKRQELKAKKNSNSQSSLFLYITVIIIAVVVIAAAFMFLMPESEKNNDNIDNINNQDFNEEGSNESDNETTYQNPKAYINTSKGTIVVELYKNKAPKTVENFIKLANDSFYKSMVFHRVIDGFMIQGGGFYPNGTKMESPYGNIDFEYHKDLTHTDGAISMASTGAKVGGTNQFFICDGQQSGLDGDYAVFGQTIEGINVVREISAVETTTKYNMQNWPVDDVIINSITVVEPSN